MDDAKKLFLKITLFLSCISIKNALTIQID